MKHLLVVDDDEYLRETLRNMLEMHNYKVSQAINGEQAIDKIKINNYDCIISDIKMPRLNGIELFKWVSLHKKTPFIMITGFADTVETKKAFEMGVTDFLAKPFKIKELADAIKQALADKNDKKIDHEQMQNVLDLNALVEEDRFTRDVFLKVGPKSFIKLGSRGEKIPDSFSTMKDTESLFSKLKK